jgi:hypothetical protein
MSRPTIFVTFDADLPDDTQWSESEEPLVPRGRAVSVLIMQALEEMGLQTTELFQRSHYGWEWGGKIGGSKFWFLVYFWDTFVLVFDDNTGIFGRMKFSRMLFPEFAEIFRDSFEKICVFSDSKWLTKEEYDFRERSEPMNG